MLYMVPITEARQFEEVAFNNLPKPFHCMALRGSFFLQIPSTLQTWVIASCMVTQERCFYLFSWYNYHQGEDNFYSWGNTGSRSKTISHDNLPVAVSSVLWICTAKSVKYTGSTVMWYNTSKMQSQRTVTIYAAICPLVNYAARWLWWNERTTW